MRTLGSGEPDRAWGVFAMQRALLASLIGLSLAIGLTAGAVAWRAATLDRTTPDVGTADPAAGYAFYDGIDQILAGKSPAALVAAVSDDFIDHTGDDTTTRSRDDLIAQLTAFGASFPGTQIQVTDMQASASSLVAAIAPIAPRSQPVAGMNLTVEPSHGGYEVLRVRNGKVSERWTTGLPEATATSFDQATFATAATTNVESRLERIALPPGGTLAGALYGSALLLVEDGMVRLRMEYRDNAGEPQASATVLGPGSATAAVSGARIQLEGEGDAPAHLLLYSARRVAPVDLPSPVLSKGSTSTLLWMNNLPLAEHGQWQTTVGSLQLPANGAVDLGVTPGTKLLVCSTGGPLQVLVHDGELWTLNSSFVPTEVGNASPIEAGTAANVTDATSISLREAPGEHGTVWLIAIAPKGQEATPVAPSPAP